MAAFLPSTSTTIATTTSNQLNSRGYTSNPARISIGTIPSKSWTRLSSALSLATLTLDKSEILEELTIRIPELQNPLNPYPARNKESEKRLKAAAGLPATASVGTAGGAGTSAVSTLAPKAGGNPLVAIVIKNTAREAAGDQDKKNDTSDSKKGGETASTSAMGSKLLTRLDGELNVTRAMAEDALLLSEEFGIDEVECYVLLRNMIQDKGVPAAVETSLNGNQSPSEGNDSTPKMGVRPNERIGDRSASKATLGTAKSWASVDDFDVRIPKDILRENFATYLAEEALALLKSMTSLCIAHQDPTHLWHSIANIMIPKILRDPTVPESSEQKTINQKAAARYVETLLAGYSIRAGITSHSLIKDSKGKGKESELSPAARLLFKSTAPTSTTDVATGRSTYRSLDLSQILHEQLSILKLLFWFLWSNFLPWSQVAMPILELAYQCDLGLKFTQSPSSGGMTGPTATARLYLDTEDKKVLGGIEMMWMLLSVSLFDIAHLLSAQKNGPLGLLKGLDSEENDDEPYNRIYDPRLLPQIHALLSNSPSDPRYSPILLSWAFVLFSVSQAAVDFGESIPKRYIPFLQTVIPDFSVDTITERGDELGRWLSSMLTSHTLTQLSVLDYLESCIKGSEESGSHIFNGQGKGRKVGFGPPIYRAVIKRLVMCVPSLVKLPSLPSNYITSYLSLSVTLFGYGPSLPELAFDYWAEDVVSESKRSIIDITSMLFPLAGSSYHLGGSLEGLIKVQRALTGVGSWELEGGNDLSSMVSNNFSSTHSPGSGGVNAYSDGIWGGANYNNGGIAALEQIRDESRKSNSRHVFHYLDQMDTYAMVLQQSGPMGFRHMWETVTEHASGSANGSAMGGESRMLYTNLHPFLLPGGSVLPAKSRGVLVSGGSGKPLIVNWAHRHSGWSLLLEVLDECANRMNNPSSSSPHLPTHPPMITQGNMQGTPHPNLHLKRGNARPIPFTLTAIGVDFSSIDIQNLIIELLDLFRSVVMHKDDASHVALFESMEQSTDSTLLVEPFEDDRPSDTSGTKKLDVAQIVVRVLSDALARAGSKSSYSNNNADTISKNHRLITSALSTLSAFARVLPHRVWPLMRSTGLLGLATDGFGFGSSPRVSTPQEYLQSSTPQPGMMVQSTTAAVLTAERATGSYSITLSIISLTRSLLDNAIESDLGTDVEAELRGQVLLNALRFMHTNIWCEYSSWKYKRLGDRFEIGRRVAEIYYDILRNWTARGDEAANSTNGAVFRSLAAYLLDVFVLNATSATLSPLVHALTVGQDMSRALKSAKRDSEDAELVWLLQTFLLLSRILLAYKQSSPLHRRQSLLEHQLCAGTSLNFSVSSRQAKSIPIDALVNFVTTNDMGPHIPVYATELLSSLALAFSEIEPSPPSLVTYMTDAEDATRALVNIVQNVYENPRLRRSIWNFMAITVEHQPALATSFVTGSFYTKEMSTDMPNAEGPAVNDTSSPGNSSNTARSALNIATQTAPTWEGLWEKDSAILCAIMRFINAAWREKLKHSVALEAVRKDTAFWTRMVWVLRQMLSPKRAETDGDRMDVDKPDKVQHTRTTMSAYHTLIQAYVIEIFAIEIRSQLSPKRPSNTTAISLMALKNFLQVGNALSQHLQEAIDSSLDIELHARVHQYFHDAFPRFALEAIQSPFPITQRIFGPEYLYQVHLLEPRLLPQFKDRETATRLRLFVGELQSVNCNWSLVDSQIELTRAWKRFLQAGGATLQGDDKLRHELLRLSVLVSQKIAQEERGGSTMTAVHTERLGVLLALLESTWSLSLTASKEAVETFTKLLQNVHAIIMSDTFSPLRSLQEAYSNDNSGFHRIVLQIAYFCTRKARTLFLKREMLTAEQTAVIAAAMLAIVGFVSVGLSNAIDMAKIQQSVELDRDMELLVAVFEQSTRPELHTSPQLWLERVQELNLARSSLELLTKCDVGGNFMSGDDLRTQRFPLYARHMLGIQLCLSSMDSSAETLALSAAMPAYCNISIANDLTVGTLNVFHPELPGDRNPGHQAWCTILAIVTGLVNVIGPNSGHFIETEVASFIQFYGAQISRALEWNVELPLNSGTIEELEGVTGLFHAVSVGVNPQSAADVQANSMLQVFAEKGLILLQHLNYALSHPNHLTSLFEATRSDERRALETEIGQGVNMASALELLDVSKRPFSASLTQRLHSIVRNIVSTLVILTRGDEVITNEPEDWPTSLQVAPTTKVSIGEGTTIGTFLELGNGIVDLLQHFKSTGVAKLATSITIPAFDSESDTQILYQSLEAVLIFSVTQLAIWHNQVMVNDMGTDEEPGTEWDDVGFGKELFTGMIGGKRVSMLPGLGGDVLNELMALLAKAKKVLPKGSNATDQSGAIIGILEGFLSLRVIG
ncbi:hypothetical protein CPB86DRAFT_869493 [Serendipita vermifera]|nr:hypothetical protein CPB86DRAFT_869493 [Serendipita vermifera]